VVAVATAAAVIASQALISGCFSLAQQAMQLGYSPRLDVVHTSSLARGQIYVPEIHYLLLVACCALTVAFRSSSSLAAAYGLAVTGTMTITSILLYAVARERWGWGRLAAGALIGLFLCIDLPFCSANHDPDRPAAGCAGGRRRRLPCSSPGSGARRCRADAARIVALDRFLPRSGWRSRPVPGRRCS
jgi:hypothetical protein